MGVQDFGTMDANATLKQVIDAVADLQDVLNFLINGNLDTNNIRSNSITSKVLKAGTITGDKIAAGAITADKISVSQLSAIAANLGTIMAGIIYGAYIATSTGYPRCEMNNSTNLLGAYLTPNDAIRIVPNFSGGNPAIYFVTGGSTVGYLQDFGTAIGLITPFGSKDIQLGSGKKMLISGQNGVEITGASFKVNGNTGRSGTYYVSATSGGPANIPLTFIDGILI